MSSPRLESGKIKWVFSKAHLKIMSWWAKGSPVAAYEGIILDGTVRSGKTLPGICSYVLWAFDRFRAPQQFIIAGKTIGALRRNVIKPLKMASASIGVRVVEKRADNLLQVVDAFGVCHEFVLFGGNDERSQDLVQGYTAAGAFFDEVPLMPRSFVDQALTRLSVEGATMWFTCNPASPKHWFMTDFIKKASDKRLLYLHLTMDDNLSLPQSVKDRLKRMFSGVFYRRYILGEWCLAEGLVYSGFDHESMVVDDPDDLSVYDTIILGADYGVQNPMVYLMLGHRSDPDRWEVVREYFYDGRGVDRQKTDAQYYADLEAFAGGTIAQEIDIDPSATSLIAAIKQSRRFRPVHANNSVLPGIQFTATLFQLGKLVVCRSCVNTLRELDTYSWDTKKSESGVDVPLKVDDHTMDALRYAANTHIRRYSRRYGIVYSAPSEEAA